MAKQSSNVGLTPAAEGLSTSKGQVTVFAESEKAQLEVFRSLAEHSPEFIGICNLEFQVFYINPAGRRLVGLDSLEQACAAKVMDYFFPEDQHYLREEFFPKVERGGSAEVEIRLRHFKTGGPVWVIYNVFQRLDSKGRLNGYATVSRDITERRAAEEALRESEERFRLMFSNSVVGKAEADPKTGRFLKVNAAMCRITGYPEKDLLARTIHDITHPEDREADAERLRTLLSGEAESYTVEKRYLKPDGGVAWAEVTVNLIRDSHGKPFRSYAVIQDITARKHAEEQLKNVALFPEQNPHPVARVDAGGTLLYANRASSELLAEWQTMVGQSAPVEIVAAVKEALKAGNPQPLEIAARGRTISFVLTPLAASGYVNLYGRDVTEQKRAEDHVRESEERFRSLADGTPVPIWVHDADGGLKFVNRAWVDFFGKTLEQAIGEKWKPLVHPEDKRAYVEEFLSCHASRRQFHAQARVQRADGQWRWIESFGVPRFSGAGEFLGMAGSSLDITARKEAEAVLARDKQELEQLVAERTSALRELVGELEHFSYSITHDMRAPLRAMMGFAQVATELGSEASGGHPEQKRCLDRIQTAAKRMDLLITDALNYSKAVRSQLPLAPVDVGQLLRGMLDTYPELQGAQAGIRIEPRLPLVIGNEAGLTQCFSNLLENAVKFSKPGQAPHIRVWAETLNSSQRADGNEWVRIWVEDRGIGIGPKTIPRVFDMFSRGASGPVGTGIGLALVRKVIQRMGGHVGVESEEGNGTRFWVELKSGDVNKNPAGGP